MRQNEKRRIHNRTYTVAARTYVKKTRSLIEAGQLDEAEKMLSIA
ncbi:MAG: 30S ribosomal protein S20, partial [Methylococcales bacterium]|nr:30S ribosomal protein S20 [Methylococcales bacterium]